MGSGTGGAGTSSSSDAAKNMIGGDLDLDKISDSIISKIAEYLDYIFEPVQVTFTNELLSHQIQSLSIILFLITICIVILFFSLLTNLTVFLFNDRLMKYFKNKYIL
jgi:hypothetical protein